MNEELPEKLKNKIFRKLFDTAKIQPHQGRSLYLCGSREPNKIVSDYRL